MSNTNQSQLEIAAAERDLLVAKLSGLLGDAGVVIEGRSLSVSEIVGLVDHLRDWCRKNRLGYFKDRLC